MIRVAVDAMGGDKAPDEIVAGARKNGVPVEYVVFPDEGHGFLKNENKIKGYTAVIAFLDKYLKGGVAQ